jgi:hypothetical protein
MRERVGFGIGHTAIACALLGLVAVGCGDGGGGGDPIPPGGDPLDGVEAGFFVGSTNQGKPLIFEIGPSTTILAVFVQCGNDPKFSISHIFDEGLAIAPDASFMVEVANQEQLRQITVTGRFVNDNFMQGTITGDPFCEGPFDAARCKSSELKCQDNNGDHLPDGVGGTPTRSPTPTATPIRTQTPSATALTPTPTPTPTVTTPAPKPTPVCGDGDIEDPEECDPKEADADTDCASFCDENAQEQNDGTVQCTTQCKLDFSNCTGVDCAP